MDEVRFRCYDVRDRDRCLALFDANSPEFFAANERPEYSTYLDESAGRYSLCEVQGELAGAFGLSAPQGKARRLNWIMLHPAFKGRGIGTRILDYVAASCRDSGTAVLKIAASHRSAPFFSRVGATVVNTTQHGWGPDMHRVDMQLELGVERKANSSRYLGSISRQVTQSCR